MVRLAVAGEPGLTASNVDAPLPGGQPNYTFDTLQKLRILLQPSDELFCLLGADSFLTLKRWHRCTELLLFCDFIVAGRPGFSLEQINAALPEGIENTGEHREAGFTRFDLSGPEGQNASLFLLPTWTRTSQPPKSAQLWRKGRSSKQYSLPRLRNTFAPAASTGR